MTDTPRKNIVDRLTDLVGQEAAMAMVKALLDRHEHLLAEAIRDEADAMRDNPFSRVQGGELDGWHAAADMIDPEVED